MGRFMFRNAFDYCKALIDFDIYWNEVREREGFDRNQWEKLAEMNYYKKMIKKGKVDSITKIKQILIHK